MAVPRVAYVWYILLSTSVLFLFYFGGRMAGLEERTARFKQPAFTPDTRGPINSAQRGLKTRGSTEIVNIDPTEATTRKLSEPRKTQNQSGNEIFRTKENIERRNQFKKLHYNSANMKIKPKHPTLFSFADYKPGNNSKPIKYGQNVVLSRLNYEFSNAKDAIKANTMLKRVPKFDPSQGNTMDIVGNIPVGEKVPVESARQILIATTWRSGSTFLGDLLNHYKGSFYYFEPLHYYSNIRDLSKVQNETSFLKSLLTCKFTSENIGFLHHVSKDANKFLFQNHNFRLWNSCHNLLPNDVMCLMPEYLNQVCPLFPIKLIKTVRLRVKNVEELLQDSSMDLKVIFLVRDPRGVYNSRSSGAVSSWCSKDKCANPEVGCQDLSNDIKAAFDLETRYPGSVRLVRYEDLSMYPEDTSMDMLDFLDLPYTDGIAEYIETHTSKEKMKIVKNKKTRKMEQKKNPYGTARNSSATAFAWRDKLGFQKTREIQEACLEPMEKLGYKLMLSEEDMRSQDLPIEKTADQVWPFE
eukprot:GFUD01027183.1.p1 GENE.GFUD01027183.1~~GFUD01027183.1.p1  ORF type:complete len:525 (+),score=91.97 GFUD01027183.1:151-1725(+)